jgi:hypothetical protein
VRPLRQAGRRFYHKGNGALDPEDVVKTLNLEVGDALDNLHYPCRSVVVGPGRRGQRFIDSLLGR